MQRSCASLLATAVAAAAIAALPQAAAQLWGTQQLRDWGTARFSQPLSGSGYPPGYTPDMLRVGDADPFADLTALPPVDTSSFISVANGSFVEGCKTLKLTGFNSYTLMEMSAEVRGRDRSRSPWPA